MKEFAHDPLEEHLTLRPAVTADAAMVFAWRNLPSVVEAASQKGVIAWEEHHGWFAASLRSDARQIFIIHSGGQPAGQIRFDWEGSGQAQVSIYLHPRFTGRGLGVKAIQAGCLKIAQATGVVRVLAWVREDNTPSQSAFRKAGFVRSDPGEVRPGLLCLEFMQAAAPRELIHHPS